LNTKLASIDIGLKRIGVAICLVSNLVIPQPAILRKNRNQAAAEIDSFLERWKIDTLVIGISDGKSKEENIRRGKHFVRLLKFNRNIEFADEGFSSYEAKNMTKGIFKHKKDGKIDSIAAMIILQRWIDGKKEKKNEKL